MKILFDQAKRETNLVKHSGLDFADLDEAFFASSKVISAKANRYIAVGQLGEDIIAVVFAVLGSEAISVISMRRASRKERKQFGQDQ